MPDILDEVFAELYPGPRVRRPNGWCSNATSPRFHPPGHPGIGVPTWVGGGLDELCKTCNRLLHPLTAAESQAASAAAESVEISPEEIAAIVKAAVERVE